MSDAKDMVRAVLLQLVPGRCRRDCGESGRPLCSAHDALAALDRVVGEERERCAKECDQKYEDTEYDAIAAFELAATIRSLR